MTKQTPNEYSRRILLAVTGLSPQIVTETLYALCVEQEPSFIPPAQDMIDGFQDWSDDVKQAKIKVTLQGKNDPNISIKASHDFAADFPDKVELIEYKEGGGLLNYSHSKEIFEWVVKHSGRD